MGREVGVGRICMGVDGGGGGLGSVTIHRISYIWPECVWLAEILLA